MVSRAPAPLLCLKKQEQKHDSRKAALIDVQALK